MKKNSMRLLGFLLVAVMVVSLLGLGVFAGDTANDVNDAAGNVDAQSSEADLVINSVDDLLDFAESVNSGDTYSGEIVALGSDLDLAGLNWTPIGGWDGAVQFLGEFDGNGKTIFNLTINDTDVTAAKYRSGFFADLGQGSSVHDLTFDNVTVTNTKGGQVGALSGRSGADLETILVNGFEANVASGTYAGAVVGITNYYSSGDYGFSWDDVDAKGVTIAFKGSETSYGGGLLGGMNPNGARLNTYENCDVTDVTITDENIGLHGGMWGWHGRSGAFDYVKNCSVTNVNITTSGTGDSRVGGICGFVGVSGGLFENVTVNGGNLVAGGGYAGGFTPWSYAWGQDTYKNCSVENVNVTCETGMAGGFIAAAGAGNQTSKCIDCAVVGGTVTGRIASGFAASDRVGNAGGAYILNGCTSSAAVTGTEYAAGLIARASSSYQTVVTGSEFTGTVSGDGYVCEGVITTHTDKSLLDVSGVPVMYINIKDGEGNPTVETYRAAVNGKYYETLADAIDAANTVDGGATVTLLADVTLSEKLTISGNVTIEGAFTITRADAYTGTLFAVEAGATLTLDGGLTIDGGNAWTYTVFPPLMDMDNGAGTTVAEHITPAEGGVNAAENMIENNGTLNVLSVTIENSYSTGGVSLINAGANSVTILDGATIRHTAANRSGAVAYIGGSNAILTIKGTTRITDNFGVGNGGIIQNYGQGTTVNLEGGSIDNNFVGSSGTLYASYSGNADKINTFNMTGGIITKNVMEGYGPVYIHTYTVWNMSGGEISENVSYLPSFVRKDNPAGSMTGGKIANNEITCLDYNGGYYLTHPDLRLNGKTAITGGIYSQNVFEYLAPNTGLAYDDGLYTVVSKGLFKLHLTDPVTGEPATIPYIEGNVLASLVATGKLFYADYYEMTLEVLYDVKVGETVVIDYPMTIDLNGHTITGFSTMQSTPVFRVVADVTVTGEGKVDGRPGTSSYAFIVGQGENAGNLTIENGTFYGDTSAISVTKGTATINGGKFAVNPYQKEGEEDNYNFLLNCIDKNYKDGTAKIVVKGGTFYKFNPAANAAEGANTSFVHEDYLVETNGDYYSVRLNKDALPKVADVVITLEGGQTITLTYPSERFDTIQKLIGTNDYADFVPGAEQSELLAYVANGDVTKIVMNLYDDIALDAPINFYGKYFQIPVEYAITVNGNGHTITWADGYNGTLINVENGVSVTLKNLTIDGENAFTFYDDTTTVEDGQNWYTRFVDVGEEDKAINDNVIVNAGNLTLDSVRITGVTIASDGDNGKTANTETGGFYLMYNDDLALIKSNGGSVTLSRASLSGNAGMVLNAINAETVIENSIIDGNFGCGNKGGIIIANGGTMELNNASICGNKAMARSATVLGVINGAEVAMNGNTRIDNNKHIGVGSNTAGAIVCLEGASQFVMNGGSISNNIGGLAGAIASRWADKDTSIVLNDGSIIGNTASNNSWNGASVFLRSPATIGEGMTIDGTIAVNAAPGALEITGGTFTGSLTVTDGLVAEITGGTFDYDPTEWVAEGYVAPKNDDGTYTVRSQTYVEWIKAELLAGNSVTLDRDVVITDYDLVNALVLPSNGNGHYTEAHGNGAVFHIIKPGVVLDLNGHSITWDAHDDYYCNKRQVSLFMVTITGNPGETADLTIIDSSAAKTGKVEVYGMGTGLYVVGVDAKGTISGGTWTNYPCKTCGASNIFIYPSHGGELYITDGTFEQKESDYLIGWNGSSEPTTNNGVGVDQDATKVYITGGTFVGFNPETDVKFIDTANGSAVSEVNGCAEGYEAADNGDGTYSVIPTKLALVEVEIMPGFWGTGYITVENWADLVAALGENTNHPVKVTLLKDIKLTDEGLTIAGTAKKVIDLNGHTITGMLVNYAELIVNDETQNGKIEGGPVAIDNYGALTVNGGFFTGEYGAIYNNELQSGKATVVIYGGEFTALGDWYATIENRYGVLTVNGGKIVATNSGGYAIVDTCGETTINGGEIVSADGIAVETYAGKIIINDGSFVGKVIVENQEGNVTVYGGTLVSNTPEYYYGMTNANGGVTVLYGGTYERDYATAEGTSVKIAEGHVSVANGENFTVVPGSENVLEIWDVDDLMTFAALANSGNNFSGWTVNLMADIDLGGMTWTPIASFAGNFVGNNHIISNFHIDATSASGGFFNVIASSNGLEDVKVKDLILSDVTATVGNARFGTLANSIQGVVHNVTVKNITVTTTHTNAWVGGMAAFMSWPWMTNCTVENLVVDATAGADLIGGFACILQKNSNHVFDNLDVKGFKVTVTDTDASGCGVGGFVAQTQRGWENPKIINSDITGIDITASGLVDVGGFIAWPGAHTIAENCHTEGKIDVTGVTSDGCFAGGFFGDLGWNCDLGQMGHKVIGCTADVDIITKIVPAGGFIGSATNSNNNSMYATFTDCVAKGDVTVVEGGTANIGGFAGNADRGMYTDCVAEGTLTNNGTGYTGGFIGYIKDTTPKYDGRYPAGTRDYLVDVLTFDTCKGSVDPFIGAVADTKPASELVNKDSYVASVGNAYYADFENAVAAAQAGDIKDIVLHAPVVITEDTTLDLTGLTVDGNGVYPAFRIQNGANVTVKGGTVTNSDYVFVLGASDGSSAGNLTIESGSYTGTTSVISVTKGTLTIEGGYFEATEYNGAHEFTLNCIDANYKDGTASIVVKGGTFYKFNPENNASEGVGTNYVPAEYMAIADGDNYVVTEWNYEIWTKADLERLSAIVNGGNTLEGVTVKLMADINLYEVDENGNRVTFAPIANNGSFNGIFEGNEHTISNLYQSGWALGYQSGSYGAIGLFGNINGATIRNLTIADAECLVEGGDVGAIAGSAEGDCTLEGITVKNSTFATYNNGCGGLIGWAGAGHYTFKDIEVDEDTVIAGLWGSFDSSLGGILGQLDEDASAHFENVHVACRIDAYNDVTASYKWYSYRMCGMLIGRVLDVQQINGTNYPDPAAADVTIGKNVVVTFGDWANYHYIWNDSLNKGCQRVEAGYAYDGIDITQYPDSNISYIPFRALFGGPQSQRQGYYGLNEYEGVLVNFPASATIGEKKYWTLEDAFAAAKDGDVITLLKDITLYDTIVTKTEGAITLDLDGYTITTENGINPAIRVLTDLTVKNGTMDTEAYCFIVGGTVDDEVVAGNLTIVDGTYTGTTSVISVTKGTLTVLGGEFKTAESSYGATYLLNCIDANYKDGSASIIVKGGRFYGFNPENNAAEGTGTNFVPMGYRASIYGTIDGVDVYDVVELKATVEAGDITYYFPGVENVDNVQELANFYFLMQSATGWILGYDYEPVLTLYAELTDEVVLGNTPSDDTDFTLPETVTWTIVTNGFDADLIKAGEDYVKIDNGDGTITIQKAVAKIKDVYYATLQEAIDKAEPGDTIVVLVDIDLTKTELQVLDGSHDTYFLVEGKSITIDLNEKVISGEYTGSRLIGVFSTDKNGALTLTGNGTVDVTATGTVYTLITAFNDGSSVVIENGTYKLDKASDSLIYYGGFTNAAVTVKGGSFTLGNVGSGENGKPWIFNVYGGGDHHVLITGGTFNADVNRQHWANEAVVAETCYMVKNDDGTWTVKDGAVAYVATGMLTGPHFFRKNVGYATIEEAFAAAVEYDDVNITLLQNVALTKDVEISIPGIVLNANGFALDCNGYEIKLTAIDATFTASEGLNVTTNIADMKVVYEDGVYKVTLKGAVVLKTEGSEELKYFDTIAAAMAEAGNTTGTDTIYLIVDHTENIVLVYDGTTLDVQDKTLTADYLVVFKGGFLTGKSYSATRASGTIKIDKDRVIIAEGCYADSSSALLPVWDKDTSSYVFGRFIINNDPIKDDLLGAKVEGDSLAVKFKVVSNKSTISFMTGDTYEDHGVSFRVVAEWTLKDKGVKVSKSYVYTDDMVQQCFGGTDAFTFKLGVTDNIENLTIKLQVVSDTGSVIEVVQTLPEGFNQ